MPFSFDNASRLWGLKTYPLREALNREFHARPPEMVYPPLRAMHLVMVISPEQRDTVKEHEHISRLHRHFGLTVSDDHSSTHTSMRCNERLLAKWERHLEFSTYTFFYHGEFIDPFENVFQKLMPEDWLSSIPGELLVATQLALVPSSSSVYSPEQLSNLFNTPYLVGAQALNGNASVFSNFLADSEGFSKILVHDHHMTGHQAGRLVQRLLDIETYRAMAILGFPRMRKLTEELERMELRLGSLTEMLADNGNLSQEQRILDDLMQLAGETEHMVASFAYRFSAGQAYHALVQHRLDELRETRIEGLPTIREFLQRRFAPAMRTIDAAYARQERLSRRVARTATLLRTRIDVALAQQNRDLLASMNQRVKLQLRLQETVEGLSIFVLGYYMVSLIAYGYKALDNLGLPINLELVTAGTIPFVLIGIWLTIRWRRKKLMASTSEGEH
ncbi:MAG: DUF3422 domain-containing protein [Burkholderiales bacterium]|jgi:uncharacterized membrane-anchored protein|nr:DUF3422 domain-containing protein [Burkholderiales bacterium]